MKLTPQVLREIMPFAGSRAERFCEALEATMTEFSIISPRRKAAFLAQIALESGELRYTLELASGDAYEGRKDLGNTEPGDGRRFKGRGLLQITGRANYEKCGKALGLDLISHPELLEEPPAAARSAGWYWASRNLNQYADDDRFGAITRLINGGYNHLDERIRYWLRARRAFGL